MRKKGESAYGNYSISKLVSGPPQGSQESHGMEEADESGRTLA